MAHLAAILVVAIWGSTFVSSKVLLNSGLLPADIFAIRFSIAYLCMAVISHRKLWADSLKDELVLMGLGLMGGSLYFLTENMALLYSTASNVSILVCSTPLLTALLLALFYKSERLSPLQALGSVVAFVGCILVILNGQLVLHLNPMGDVLALAAALTWAFYSLLMRRLMGRYPTDFITRKVFFYGVLTIIPYFVFVHPFNTSLALYRQPLVLANLGFLSLVASTACFLLWNWVIRMLGAVRPTNYIYMQSFVSMLVSHLVLNEQITLMGVLGATVLIGGMAMMVRSK